MKKLILICVLFLLQYTISGQGVSINNTGAMPDATAILDVSDTAKGILIPRLTEVQKNAIATPATSLLIYQTDGTTGYYFWNGSEWKTFSTGGGGGGTGWLLSGNAGTSPGTDFLGTTDAQDLVIKTKNSEQIRIDTSGNVGIATDTAYTKLVVNGGFTTSPSPVVDVTADNTHITVGNTTYLKINSTRTLAATANITLSDGLDEGQLLLLYNSSASNFFVRINNSGNIILRRDWLDIPGQGCATFFWNGVKWAEISRQTILPTTKQVFNCTGGNQSFLVPEGVYSMQVKIWGAGGANDGGSGGGGAYVNGYLGVTPGQTLTLVVGKAGWRTGSQPYGGGGGSSCQGAGGGRSAIIISGTEVVTAGAGGGGTFGTNGGAAAGIGLTGSTGDGCGGLGGSPTAGGAGGNCGRPGSAGSQFNGGCSCDNCAGTCGGGGGGGWYGGGGGNACPRGGGGGGSSNFNASYFSLISSESGSGSTAGGAGDSDRGGAGNGGSDGKIVLIY